MVENAGRTGLRPVAAVERAVLNGFGDVLDGDAFGCVEVGDRASNLEDAVVRSSAEALLLHGALEEFFGVAGELAVCSDLLGRHLRVRKHGAASGARIAVGARAAFEKARMLSLAGLHHAGANLGRALGGLAAAEFLVLHRGVLNVDVDAV